MFDWVLNMPLPLDGCYFHGLSSLCVYIVVPECLKDVVSRLQCTLMGSILAGIKFGEFGEFWLNLPT